MHTSHSTRTTGKGCATEMPGHMHVSVDQSVVLITMALLLQVGVGLAVTQFESLGHLLLHSFSLGYMFDQQRLRLRRCM